MRALIILITVIVGGACAEPCPSWDPQAVILTPAPVPEAWPSIVARAADAWSDAVEPLCGYRPVRLGEGGHLVELVPGPDWTAAGYAIELADALRIRADMDTGYYMHFLLWGIGRAAGVTADEHYAMMSPDFFASHLYAADAHAWARAAGCEP